MYLCAYPPPAADFPTPPSSSERVRWERGPYVEMLEAFEVILAKFRDVIVLQVQQCGVR
jgi:hypothetical protein